MSVGEYLGAQSPWILSPLKTRWPGCPLETLVAWLSLGDCLPWSIFDPSTGSSLASASLIFPSACLTVQQLTQSPGNWSSVQLSSALLQILSVIRNCSQSPSELQRQLPLAHKLSARLLLVKFRRIWLAKKKQLRTQTLLVICKDFELDWTIAGRRASWCGFSVRSYAQILN